jgi:hypothetical protein
MKRSFGCCWIGKGDRGCVLEDSYTLMMMMIIFIYLRETSISR